MLKFLESAPVPVILVLNKVDLITKSRLLPLIDLPTTVVCGVNDLLTTHSENQRIAELIPSAEIVTVAQAGHMFIWESPNEITEAILRNVDTVTS